VRVLVATDGSAHAERAVSLVAAQPWPEGSVFRVVVADDGPLPSGEVAGGAPLVYDGYAGGAEDPGSVASRATELLTRPGWSVTSEVLRGRAATVVVEEGQRFDADLIVVGSRGRGPLGSLALGSVSAEVVDHAGRPVLVARSDGEVGPIGRIVMGDDGSPAAVRALAVLAEWSVFAGSQITVACVAHVAAPLHSAVAPTMVRAVLADYHRSLEEARAARDRVCASAMETLETASRRATASPREGDPADEILAVAREHEADLIVVGSRGKTGLARLLLGSVARNVLYEARCSVLVVR
jgi:nucleotide-binding universal stress UspA family protein